MRVSSAVAVVFAAALAISACEADRETFESGATLEPPEEVENAPLITDVGGERLEGEANEIIPEDTLRQVEIEIDTAAP